MLNMYHVYILQTDTHPNRRDSADSTEAEVDYFQDMIPQVKKQPKVCHSIEK